MSEFAKEHNMLDEFESAHLGRWLESAVEVATQAKARALIVLYVKKHGHATTIGANMSWPEMYEAALGEEAANNA